MSGFDLSDLLWPDVSQGRQAQDHAAVERGRRSPLFVINGTEITDATDRKIAVIGAVTGTGPSGRCISANGETRPFISSPSSVITGDRTVVLVCKSNTTSVTAVYYTSSSAGGVAYWVGQHGTAWTIGGGLSGSSNSANQTDQVVVAVKNGATHTLYIDGVQVASGTDSLSDGTGSSFLTFGTENGYDVWPSRGQLYVAALYDVALDATEIKSISRNPKIFKTPVNIPFVITSAGGGSSTNLIIQDSTHSLLSDNLDLSTSLLLTIQDSTHNLTSDSLILSTDWLLTIQDSTHSLTSDNLILNTTGSTDLIIQEATHSVTSDNLLITTEWLLDIASAAHALTSDNLDLSTALSIIIQNAIHSHTSDNLVLDTSDTTLLTIQDAVHNHTADNLDLTLDTWLVIANAVHSHLADNIDLGTELTLTIQDSTHNLISDIIVLSIPSTGSCPTVEEIVAAIMIQIEAKNYLTLPQFLSFK